MTQDDKTGRWQFGLKALFAVTTLIAVLAAHGSMILAVLLLAVGGVFLIVSLIVAHGAQLLYLLGLLSPLLAIGALTGWIVTRAIVLIGRYLDARSRRS